MVFSLMQRFAEHTVAAAAKIALTCCFLAIIGRFAGGVITNST